MHILQTCIRYPPAPGGAETHVYYVSKYLQRRGHQVEVFTSDLYREIPFTRLRKDVPDYNVHDGIPIRRFRAFSIGGDAHYVFMPCMTFNLLAVNPDLIHAHSYGYFQVNLSALMRWLKRVPFVITPHFHPLWSMWGGARRKYLRRFYDKLIAPGVLRAADRIVGVSQHEIELLKTACGKKLALSLEDKIRIIPNGIDLTRFCSQIPSISGEQFRALYGIEDYMVLYTGRLASNKGLQVLVAAAPIVLRAYPNTKFVLVGEDAGMKPQLVAKAKKLGVLDKFIFTGHIRDDDVFISAYKACDLFVLPSEYEAFGIVLLEAMAASKPCIATRVGGILEALGDPDNNGAGILVDYGDARQLARAIIMLLSDADLRRKMGMCGRKRVQTRFSWQTIVARLEKEVYMELV